MRRVDTHLFNWRSLAATLTAVCGLATLAACGGGGGGGKKPPPPPPTLTSISVAPAAPTIALGGTQQFSATGNYSDGSAQSLTATATWSSSNMAVATIGSGGLATSAGSGSTTISAASGTVTGTTTLTVTVVNALLGRFRLSATAAATAAWPVARISVDVKRDQGGGVIRRSETFVVNVKQEITT